MWSTRNKILIPQAPKAAHELQIILQAFCSKSLTFPGPQNHHICTCHKHNYYNIVLETDKLFPVLVSPVTIWEKGTNGKCHPAEIRKSHTARSKQETLEM